MNVLKAAKETIELWEKTTRKNFSVIDELSFEHCQNMLNVMLCSPEFSYGKLCRWLGWMQACCVLNTGLELEEMKEVNKRNKDDVTKT